MKKSLFLLFHLFCAFELVHAQETIVDNATQGAGLGLHAYNGGGWVHGTNLPSFHNGTFSYTNVTDAYVYLQFNGQQVRWFTEKKWTHGIAAVSIDNGPETMVD